MRLQRILSRTIWAALTTVLNINSRVFGPGATVELTRDLRGTYRA